MFATAFMTTAPKAPAKKRETMSVAKFCATACGIKNMTNRK